MQNKTINAAVVTCSDSRFISEDGLAPEASELAEFPVFFLGCVRICPVTRLPIYVSYAEREDALLTNEGMLMILCLEVEELLKSVCSNSLTDAFTNGKRRKQCP